MKKYLIARMALMMIITVASLVSLKAQSKASSIKGEEVTYSDGTTALKGYVAYNEKQSGKRPAIIVVPEWWGNNEYTRKRARMLAELGYIAIAADMYGDGKLGSNPSEAQALATPFYKDPQLGKSRIEAAIKKVVSYPQADAQKIAAIGYCFGGSMVLNAAKMGENLKGVVSFHGGLATVPARPGVTKAKILVCHGGADKFISDADIKNFKNNLDSIKVPYTFKTYEGATHAFSNPAATATGKKFNMPIEYNEAADKQSWKDMQAFFKTIF
ncbi:MAG: dienelactone hydrolase family protein [Ferruginibacter sp.]|nr:dienelactone hydrolase family protein [Ferruginibacter sp.]